MSSMINMKVAMMFLHLVTSSSNMSTHPDAISVYSVVTLYLYFHLHSYVLALLQHNEGNYPFKYWTVIIIILQEHINMMFLQSLEKIKNRINAHLK